MSALVRIDKIGLVAASTQLSTEKDLLYTTYARNDPSRRAGGLFVAASTPMWTPGVLLDYANYKTEQGVSKKAYAPMAQYDGAYGRPYNFRENTTGSAWLEPNDESGDCIVTQSMLAKALKKACPFNFTSTSANVTNTSSIPENTIVLRKSSSHTIDGMFFSDLHL